MEGVEEEREKVDESDGRREESEGDCEDVGLREGK